MAYFVVWALFLLVFTDALVSWEADISSINHVHVK